ncbi:MAG: L-aspartate oxidase [Gammaproteobacteria bacterium]|nr:L-aspartate oxidase [Gammaproteobacteria bacterium]
MRVQLTDTVVVGSGISGLVTALCLSPRDVTLVSKTPTLLGGSSLWAKGGIAAAVGPDDSAAAHAEDTLMAGAGLSNPERTRQLTEEGSSSLAWLIGEGILFDRDANGELALAREAAHRYARVVHAGGDATGLALVRGLARQVQAAPGVAIRLDTFAYDLVVQGDEITGLLAFDPRHGWTFYRARNVVLCTGGIGQAWIDTTNPAEASGDGLAMAARAGARLADLEFVQFHPTALRSLAEPGASLPLLTEALRGAGALLLDELGQRFMLDEHPQAELAPRDIVARAIQRRTRRGESVYLDLRPIHADRLRESFPQAIEAAVEAGFDPFVEPLPVVAAAHYHMGGVQVDDAGRTSLRGLWACGETATTGIHGANRLASNSLLEAVAYARRVAADIPHGERGPRVNAQSLPATPLVVDRVDIEDAITEIRHIMSREVAVLRDGVQLERAFAALGQLESQLQPTAAGAQVRPSAARVRAYGEARNLNLVARLVTLAALRREESRGAHFRNDFPEPSVAWRRQLSMTIDSLSETH